MAQDESPQSAGGYGGSVQRIIGSVGEVFDQLVADHLVAASFGARLNKAATLFESAGNGISLLSDASVDVKGAWIEQITAAARAANYLIVNIGSAVAAINFGIDIGIGEAASEVVLIPDIAYRSENGGTHSIVYPCRIESGIRVAARVVNFSDSSARAVTVSVQLAF